MKPSSEMTKPDPSAWLRRGPRSGPRRSRNSVEEVLERRALGHHGCGPFAAGDDGGSGDVHDRIAHLVDEIGECGRRCGLRTGLLGRHHAGEDDHGGNQKRHRDAVKHGAALGLAGRGQRGHGAARCSVSGRWIVTNLPPVQALGDGQRAVLALMIFAPDCRGSMPVALVPDTCASLRRDPS